MSGNKEEYTGFDPTIWPQIQFHNERIYENLKLFFQITLAICGGLAYIAVNKVNQNKELIVNLIYFVAWLQIFLGLYFAIAIFMHLLSKIRRYKYKSNLFWKSFSWIEPYMMVFVILISIFVALTAYFKIATAIVNA